MVKKPGWLFFALLIYLSVIAFHISFAEISRETKHKIDPSLYLLLNKIEKRLPAALSTMEVYMDNSEPQESVVGILVKSSYDIRDIVNSLGGTTGSRHGDIYTATLPLEAVPVLAEQQSVMYIEASRKMENNLDFALPKSGAAILHDLPVPAGLTGKGVIIGFTDTGIDFEHQDFRDENDNSRVLYIWDHSVNGTRPAGFNYGAEFDFGDINSGNLNHKDEDGHGSHVAGIAVSDGSATGNYKGVAPEANIIMIKNSGQDLFNRGLTTRGTLDGYDYIRTKAHELNMRHVINTSQGTTLGPHDGKTLFEQAVNNDVAEGSVIVVSAGNYGNAPIHAEAFVDPDSGVTLLFSIAQEGEISGDDIEIDIWFETDDYLEAQVAGPTVDFQDKVSILQTKIFDTVDGRISVVSELFSPLNQDNRIMVIIDNLGSEATEIARGFWKIRLTAFPGNTLPAGGEVDAWFERNDPVSFIRHVDFDETLGMPACADSAITVGSYNNRTGSMDDISGFSSRGPRRDDVLKPDITALGGGIISVLSSQSDDDPSGDDLHTQKSGTSMSTPFVAGAAALLLQADSTLKPGQVKSILMNSARVGLFTGEVPNNEWGAGKLDILSAVRPFISDAQVSGVVKDSVSGEGIAAEIVFEISEQP
ncbi:S8 family serine peptidase, partial [candidate division KSB1 bacterium]|nr:S8 family serine peptidase [candidate division KSB1 bacterium]